MKDRRLWLLLAVALGIRLALMPLPDPFEADLSTFWRPWMAFGAQHGLAQLYQHGEPAVNYPPFYLALLSALGALYRLVSPELAPSPLQSFLIKLPAVVADLAVTVMLYVAVARSQRERGREGERERGREGESFHPLTPSPPPLATHSPTRSPALLAAALWALNPAVIYVSAYWGQVDSIQAMWMLAALLAAVAGSWGWSGILLALGLLTKLQAVVIAPQVAALAWRAGCSALVRSVLGAAGVLALGLAPLIAAGAGDPLLQVYRGSIGFYRNLTLGAYNVWWPPYWLGERLLGRRLTDDIRLLGPVTVQWIGLALFAAYALLVLWVWIRGQGARGPAAKRSGTPEGASSGQVAGVNGPLAFFAAGMLVFGFFMLPTEMHERYVLPALAFLPVVAALDRRLLAAYLLLSASVFLNLLEVLPFALWIFRLFASIPGERLALSLLNLALLAWLTYRYVQMARLDRSALVVGDGEAEFVPGSSLSEGAS